jgi:hypothetical protein
MSAIEVEIGAAGVLESKKDILDIIKIVHEIEGIVNQLHNQIYRIYGHFHRDIKAISRESKLNIRHYNHRD